MREGGSMKGRTPNPLGESLTGRQRRVLALAGAIVLVLIAGAGGWAIRDSGSYGRSASGCVNVTMPSTTGGGLMHGCGATARAMCQRAATHHNQLALLTRVQCRQAGLIPAPSPRPSNSP
ncbi:MAG: hypothetical protein J2P34_04140 [Actinobacteria bacterium]|nr:hypothetical protein [Actinomycetota bacterium]